MQLWIFRESLTYHVNSHIVAQAFIAWQQVTKNNGASLWPVSGLHQNPGVDLQWRDVLVIFHQIDVVHLKLTQGFVIIILPEFKFVKGHKHTTLILTAKELAALVGALCEALAPALLLGDGSKGRMMRQVQRLRQNRSKRDEQLIVIKSRAGSRAACSAFFSEGKSTS